MKSPPIQPLRYDPQGVFLSDHGLTQDELSAVYPKLQAIRQEVLEEDLNLFRGEQPIPQEKLPLDAGFIELPERLLAEYDQSRSASELGRILATARRLRETVDRVVVLGVGGSYMGARALLEACCEPYFNELSRAQRGGRPRMYFEGNNVDNDATQGLLDLLENGDEVNGVDNRWAIVVISKSGGTLETAVALRQFLAALRRSCGDDDQQIAQLMIPITGSSGRLFDLSQEIGCADVFQVPDGVGGRFSILSAVGLFPAAILEIDVVQLLRGAVAMNEHFRTVPVEENVVMRFVAVSHLMEVLRGANIRLLSVWAKSLESVGFWYDQLLAESLGKNELGVTPLTVLNTRDLHSRAQQHQQGRRDKLITNLIVDTWRCDPLAVGTSEKNQDRLNDLAERTLPDIMAAAIQGTNEAYREDGRATADIHLPDMNEATLGQLFQMLMLATAVEGRLLGINPYGQPGVEKYKTNMNRLLGR
ncbi:MAG: glucose-6-phosphate isomerase [Planctomycetes bacterium]|nr:glucose-6-phosphate isomerase [Planctomycetota bacterium]